MVAIKLYIFRAILLKSQSNLFMTILFYKPLFLLIVLETAEIAILTTNFKNEAIIANRLCFYIFPHRHLSHLKFYVLKWWIIDFCITIVRQPYNWYKSTVMRQFVWDFKKNWSGKVVLCPQFWKQWLGTF